VHRAPGMVRKNAGAAQRKHAAGVLRTSGCMKKFHFSKAK
jgi:hypothetical protein